MKTSVNPKYFVIDCRIKSQLFVARWQQLKFFSVNEKLQTTSRSTFIPIDIHERQQI